MRRREAGRAAIEGLLDDELPYVRLAASTDSWGWSPDRAEATLRRLTRLDSIEGFYAELVLKGLLNGGIVQDKDLFGAGDVPDH